MSIFRRENIQMKEDWKIQPWRQLRPAPCILTSTSDAGASPGQFTSWKRIRVYFESEDDWNPSRPGILTISAAETCRLSPQPFHYTEDKNQLTQWKSPSWETSSKRVRYSPNLNMFEVHDRAYKSLPPETFPSQICPVHTPVLLF
jgi:hypothetical protein